MLETILLTVTSVGSVGTLALFWRVAADYGKRVEIQDRHVEAIERIEAKVDMILGNGHPGPFVPRELYDVHVGRAEEVFDRVTAIELALARKG